MFLVVRHRSCQAWNPSYPRNRVQLVRGSWIHSWPSLFHGRIQDSNWLRSSHWLRFSPSWKHTDPTTYRRNKSAAIHIDDKEQKCVYRTVEPLTSATFLSRRPAPSVRKNRERRRPTPRDLGDIYLLFIHHLQRPLNFGRKVPFVWRFGWIWQGRHLEDSCTSRYSTLPQRDPPSEGMQYRCLHFPPGWLWDSEG